LHRCDRAPRCRSCSQPRSPTPSTTAITAVAHRETLARYTGEIRFAESHRWHRVPDQHCLIRGYSPHRMTNDQGPTGSPYLHNRSPPLQLQEIPRATNAQSSDPPSR
jgi:hypothetical protein